MRTLLISVVLIFVSSLAAAQNASEQFVGAWRLVASELQSPTGDLVPAENPATHGLLIYTSGGRMSVQLMGDERSPFAAFNPTVEEAHPAFMTYVAYYGTFSVNEEEQTVTHHREGNLRPLSPSVIDATRSYEFSGNRLTLSRPPIVVDGEEVIPVLTFERAE